MVSNCNMFYLVQSGDQVSLKTQRPLFFTCRRENSKLIV
jgi:hypothetical protein